MLKISEKAASLAKKYYSSALLFLLSLVFLSDFSGNAAAKKKDCHPKKVYGPPPCHSDEYCVQKFGEGWYCNKDHGYDDGCGRKIIWPVCSEKKKQEPPKPH